MKFGAPPTAPLGFGYSRRPLLTGCMSISARHLVRGTTVQCLLADVPNQVVRFYTSLDSGRDVG